MSGKRLALTERDKRLLAEVQRFGVLTRAQAMRLGLFASKTRANARLKRLTDGGYLASRPQALLSGGPRLVYMPGKHLDTAGAHPHRDVSELFLAHQLGLVDIRVAFEHAVVVTRWLSDRDLKPAGLGVVPDAYLEFEWNRNHYSAFVEYDRGTESLVRVERKAKAYVDLAYSGRFEREFRRRFFRTLFIAETPGRAATLSAAVSRITDRVVRLTTLPQLSEHGPLAVIWRRPGSSHSKH
jgi:hypothetical protein